MDIKEKIKADLDANPVKLYMKGSPSFPQCGFSKHVVDILANYDTEFGSSNILEDPEIRQGLKDYFDWPTFPMLVVNGELVGGCDIISELHADGELADALKGE
ncbi:MAG: Grx4 family monothiol glutaredoxin [Lentisphaeraceae bacterium]|nr:Grx4 family monothiol glutaredoxin [Lentisphaeraceae bacterium]